MLPQNQGKTGSFFLSYSTWRQRIAFRQFFSSSGRGTTECTSGNEARKMATNRIRRGSRFSLFIFLLALGGSLASEGAEPASPRHPPTGCPCWTFEELSNEFLNDPHDIYCITSRSETEIISERLTGATHISSASVMPWLFNDPNTGRCNASFENVRLFNSSFIEDPIVIEACLDDLDQLRELRPCR